MSRQKVLADREQYVAKSNDLIRKSRYSLTAQQQKIILYIISKIKPDDDISTHYILNIKELAEACGIKLTGTGYYYSDLKQDIKSLTKRDWAILDDGTQLTMSWLGDAKMVKGDTQIEVWFNENMKDYLFDLKKRYTLYRLEKVLVFKGKYAIRLYEILRSNISKKDLDEGMFEDKDVTITIKEFRDLFDLKDKYTRWVDIDRYIVKPAIAEINEKSDEFNVARFPMRGDHTRAIEKINFVVKRAKCGQQLIARTKKRQILDDLPM